MKVLWYHAIFSAYGHWLPNDPRGSWSDFVHAYELFRFGGPATTVRGKRSYAYDPHDAESRREAKEHLKYPAVRFNEASRASIARGFANACDEFGFLVHACAISDDHVHIAAARDETRDIEQFVAVLKARATSHLTRDGTHPLRAFFGRDGRAPTPWGKSLWSVFLRGRAETLNAIAYVEAHPEKDGFARQAWDFVRPFDPRRG